MLENESAFLETFQQISNNTDTISTISQNIDTILFALVLFFSISLFINFIFLSRGSH